MDLSESIMQRRAIKAITEAGDRLVSHMHVDAKGKYVIWGEKDWITSSTHGVHLLDGLPTGSGPWRVAGVRFVELDESDDLLLDYAAMVGDEKENGHDYNAAVKVLAKAFD